MVGQSVVGFHCLTSYRWSDTVCYRFPLLLVVQQVSTLVSGPTLCVTYSRCYQQSNTLYYIFPLLSVDQHCVLHISTVISDPTRCVTYSHCYQRSNTVCYRVSLLSAVQYFVLQVFTVISGPTLCATSLHCHQRAVNDDIASKTFGHFFFPLYTPSQTIRLVSSHFFIVICFFMQSAFSLM